MPISYFPLPVNKINWGDINGEITEQSDLIENLESKSDNTHNHNSDYAPITKGVTNGDSHDHSGGDGSQIDHLNLSNAGSNTHAQIDSHIANIQGFYFDKDYYYQRNTKLICNCESAENWTVTGTGSESNDTTYYKIGLQAEKFTGSNQWSGLQLDSLSLDLTKFNDESTSAPTDYIQFPLYIEDITKFNTGAAIFLGFYTDGSNYFWKTISKSSLATGWNYLSYSKSSFSAQGNPNWNNITKILVTYAQAAISSTSFTFDSFQLVRKDPLTSAPNPFQKEISGTWTREMSITSGTWFIGLENNIITTKVLNNGTSEITNTINFNSVTATLMMRLKENGYSSKIAMVYDSSNYIEGYLNDNTATLKLNNNGTITTKVISFTVNSGDMLNIELSKRGSSITAIFMRNYDVINHKVLTDSVTFTNDINIKITGNSRNNESQIIDLNISNVSSALIATSAMQTERIRILSKTGAFTADELNDGEFGYDSGNSRLYVKIGTALNYLSLTLV
jgi:hypothetical protein